MFARDASPARSRNRPTTSGCIANAPTDGCTTGIALDAPEGMAISADGNNVYVAAALSNAVAVLTRDPSTGALTQATDGSGCIIERRAHRLHDRHELSGANAVAVSPDDGDVYVTSLISNSLTSFTRTAGTGQLTQQSGTRPASSTCSRSAARSAGR